ncbi:stonustoxin subunit alpha [Chelonia mydas]|uniref:stonustoxin subunit alpha n=1 Tax=Chelonia mydas TaxID=8469 RepID=UPI001CA889A2|nr:stonustoxin subunit alpha [Chelonia mydas]
MARSADTIEMSALGRPFQLGMLYDCRSDALIPGITLWDLETLQNDVDAKPQSKTEFQIVASDTTEDKASALSVTASLKASFLLGLVEVGGSAEYLSDTKTSKHQARVSLQYSTTTQFKQLTMSHLGYHNISYPDVFDQATATHVVTAVLYGAQAFFVFDQDISSSENIQEIQGKLQVIIKKIPQVSIEGEGALKMDDTEKKQAEKLSCKFYGDFALENNPSTYQDAMKTYSTLPKLLGAQGEKAVPVRVWLYPLTKLDSRAARLVREISTELIFDVQTALEQLTELEMRCNDAGKNPIASTFPEIKRKIQQFKDLCKQHRQTFQKQLAGILPSIRGGGKEEGALVDILTYKNQSPFNTQQLNEFMDKKEREMTFINSYLSVLEDVEVVSSRNKLDEIVLDPMNDFVVAFMFTSLHEEEPYLSDLKLCLQTQFMKNTQDPASASSVSEKSKLWVEDKERNQKARKSAKSISDFARVNKSHGKTRFIVASVPDEDNPGASIYLYENGELVNASYELPSKPLSLLTDGVRHDHVQLTFKPAAFGRKEITGYRVEHRMVGQENWTAVDTNDKQETFTVTGLRANTTYQFRYAAVSKPGLSESSDVSDPLETAVQGLQPQIKAGLTKLEELRQTQRALEQHQGEMEANKDFEYEVGKTVPVKLEVIKDYLTNCQTCHYTCHYPCGIADDKQKNRCSAMDKSGRCTVCPGKCQWNVHFNQKYRWDYKVVKEKQTYTQLKEKYEKASGEVMTTEKIFEQLFLDYTEVEDIVLELIERSSLSLQRLQEIALKPNPLSTPDYIDQMVMSEEQEAKPGYQERIQSLSKVRETAVIKTKTANNEELLPAELEIYKKRSQKRSRFQRMFDAVKHLFK